MTIGSLAVALLLASAIPASAEGLRLPLVIFGGAAASDMVTTHRFLNGDYDLREANPIVNWIPERHAMLAFGAAVEGTAVFLGVKYLAPKHPRLVKIALYAVAGLHASLAYHNYRNMQRERKP